MTDNDSFDCVIIGGGPGGSTVGTVLADHGRSVVILERSRFPRHHIGESLMPETYWTFKRLGLLDKMKASDFPRKQSVQFVSATGADSQPYFFADRNPHECSVTWQVRRDRFDRMMLDNAREHGAQVRQGVRVTEVIFDRSQAVGVRAVEDGREHDIQAKVVVDATGMSTLLSRQLGLRRTDPVLKKAAVYAYFRGAQRDEGRNAGATVVIHTPQRKGWFWFIPLPDDVASIGIVASPSYLCTGRGDDPLATLDEEIANCQGIRRRLDGAQRISQAYVTSDFSYRATRVAGDGWVLVGDAFGFLDPIYSSGVFLALKSGEMAADAIEQALVAGDVGAERLGVFGPKLATGMHQIAKLVHAFYDRDFSFGKFHREHPEYHDHIVRLLIGDVFSSDVGDVFDVMRERIDLPAPIELETGGDQAAPRSSGRESAA